LLCIFSGSRLDSFALFVYVRFHDDSFFVRQFTGVYEFQNINYSQGTVPHGFFVSPGASGRKESTSESDAGGEKVWLVMSNVIRSALQLPQSMELIIF
jgi:hypothetical protein